MEATDWRSTPSRRTQRLGAGASHRGRRLPRMPLPDADHVGPGAGDDLQRRVPADPRREASSIDGTARAQSAGPRSGMWSDRCCTAFSIARTTIWSEDQLMVLDRRGFDEDCYFTFSYSPIRSHVGEIEGVLVTVFETTDQVVGERRMSCLRELAEARADARSSAEVIQRAAACPHRFSSGGAVRLPVLHRRGRRSKSALSPGFRKRFPPKRGRSSSSSTSSMRRCRSKGWTTSCGAARPTRGRGPRWRSRARRGRRPRSEPSLSPA